MRENHNLRQSQARTDLSIISTSFEPVDIRATQSAPDIQLEQTNRRPIWASKSRIGLGTFAVLGALGMIAMGGMWMRSGSQDLNHIDDGDVMVEPITHSLPLNPLPPPKEGELMDPLERAKTLPYRLHLSVNGQPVQLNFTAYRPPEYKRFAANFWHFSHFEGARHLNGGRVTPMKGFDLTKSTHLDMEQLFFRITIPLAPPARGVMHKLDNSSSIPVNETLAGHLVFEDPIVPAMSIIRTSKSTGNRQVWPFGELYEPSLKLLNEVLLDFDIDERLEPQIWIESIQLPSYSDIKRYMKKFQALKRLQTSPNLEP